MSLAINPDQIDGLLLPDGWHYPIQASVSFDAFEYVWPDDYTYIAQPKAESTGLTWKENRQGADLTLTDRYFAPLNTILAVRYEDIADEEATR